MSTYTERVKFLEKNKHQRIPMTADEKRAARTRAQTKWDAKNGYIFSVRLHAKYDAELIEHIHDRCRENGTSRNAYIISLIKYDMMMRRGRLAGLDAAAGIESEEEPEEMPETISLDTAGDAPDPDEDPEGFRQWCEAMGF